MNILFLNGPPRCGKDTAGTMIRDKYLGQCRVDKFARRLKEAVHGAYRLLDSYGRPMRHDSLEFCKDTPMPEFLGLTPRQAYIAFSEQFMKPLHGQDVFGQLLLRDLALDTFDLLVLPDCGFRDEVVSLVEHYGAENCTVLRIHREGCSFQEDSRSYLDFADLHVAGLDIVNPGNKSGLLAVLRQALPSILP